MVTCEMCLEEHNEKTIFSHYFKKHILNKNGKFKCLICNAIFCKFVSYKSHHYRTHNQKMLNKNPVKHFKCLNCNFVGYNQQNLVNHVYTHFCGDSVICSFFNCKRVFVNQIAFKTHYYRNHFKSNKFSILTETLPDLSVNPESEELIPRFNINDNINPQISEDSDLAKRIALIFLRLKSQHSIPDNLIDIICDEFQNLLITLNADIENQVKLKLGCQFNSAEILQPVQFCMSNFEQLKNKYFRNLYFQQNFKFVKPVEIILGKDNFHNDAIYHYVPILETIKSLLSDPSVYNKIFKSNKPSENNIYRNHTDGKVFRNNPFFISGQGNLQLILYQDSFEICNPLGSSKLKHKILALYMTIGNIADYNKSKIDNIQLVFLCKEKHVKFFGIDKIFSEVVKDLQILEKEGVELEYPTKKHVYGTIFCMLGDNLGSHQIGGYTENFSTAEYLCRFCYFSKNNLSQRGMGSKELRNIQNYKHDISNLHNEVRISKGLKRNSCLNKLKYFHVAQPGLPPCIAHDLFEGVVAYDMILIIKYFIEHGYLSYNVLNQEIIHFSKKLDLSMSFPKISRNSTRLGGTAHQNWVFIIIFPFIINKYIENYDDDVCRMFVSLLKVCQISCCHQISENQIKCLKFYIEEYHRLRILCFESVRMRPKHHYMIHYPYLMRQLGPLIKLWTLRFECKHQFFKRIATRCKNFVNITKLLSERHQLYQSSLFLDRFPNDIVCDKIFPLCPDMFQVNLHKDFTFVSESVVICGITYKKSNYVAIRTDDNFNVVVMKILSIFIQNDYKKVLLYGDIAKFWYNYKVGFYESFSKDFQEHECIDVDHLLEPFPVHLLKYDNLMYFTTKTSLNINIC